MDSVQKRGARVSALVVLSVMVVLIGLGGGAVQAQTGGMQGTSGLVSLDVVDADLTKVVLMLARESKQSIVISNQDKVRSKVTLTLRDVPLETALKYVVESVGCSYHREPDGVYVIGGRSQMQTSAGAGPARDSSVPLADGITSYGGSAARGGYEARREQRVDTIKLYNADPVDMMWMLGLYDYGDASVVEKSPAARGVYVQQSDGRIEPFTVPDQLTPPLTESLRPNAGYAERAPSIAGEAAQYGYPPGPPSYGGRPSTTGTTPPRTTGQAGTAPGVPGGTGGASANLLPEGIDYIVPYAIDNSLIVRGDAEGIEELKGIVRLLDIAPKQIMIEARFVTISTNAIAHLGIDWDLSRLNTSFSTQFGPAGPVTFGYASGNVMATLRTQLDQKKVNLINAPLVSTMNNQMATVGFTTGVPFTEKNIIFNAQGNPTTVENTRILNISTMLNVLPRINSADNSITCLIQPQISDTDTAPVSGQLPVVNSQWIQTTRRVANGETIVIGGLIRKHDIVTVEKIPLLGDLPLLGPLFRNTEKNDDDRELLIFLTPTIVPEKPIAGTGIGVLP